MPGDGTVVAAPEGSGGRASWALPLHALAIWAACAATMGIGMAVASLETALAVHAAGAPVFAAAVSVVYFRRRPHASPLITAAAFLAVIMLVDFFLVALVVNRSLDMFRSVPGTW